MVKLLQACVGTKNIGWFLRLILKLAALHASNANSTLAKSSLTNINQVIGFLVIVFVDQHLTLYLFAEVYSKCTLL